MSVFKGTKLTAALRCRGEVKITDAEAVSKSYPRFFGDFKALGGKADVGI